MASQITHIVLADKLLPTYFRDFERQLFLLGNIFPDIRTPAHLKREKTHLPVKSIANVQSASDAFMAGVLLHNLIDEKREKFVESSGVYGLFQTSLYPPTVFKAFEDVQLYRKLPDWETIIDYLEFMPEQAASFGIDNAELQLWHKTLREYFADPLSEQARTEFLKVAKPDTAGKPTELSRIIKDLDNDPRARAVAAELYDNIEKILRD